MGLLAPRATTIWNSCIDAVRECDLKTRRYSRHARTKVVVEHPRNSIGWRVETGPPVLQRRLVVQSKVFDVEHREILRLEHVLEDFGQCRGVRAREDPPTDPSIQGRRSRAADEVQQAAPVGPSSSRSITR